MGGGGGPEPGHEPGPARPRVARLRAERRPRGGRQLRVRPRVGRRAVRALGVRAHLGRRGPQLAVGGHRPADEHVGHGHSAAPARPSPTPPNVHSFHTRRGSSGVVATVLFVWRGRAKSPTTRAGPSLGLTLRLESCRLGGRQHMFGVELTGSCGIGAWQTNSQVVHWASDAPAGPWKRVGVALAPQATCPSVAVAPNGTLVMTLFGGAPRGRQNHAWHPRFSRSMI